MIKKIKMNTIPFKGDVEQEISDLKLVNYFFGSNGSGKTTISRIIEQPDRYNDCALTWENGTKLECRVYNRDFIEENFNESSTLKGVFTLGKTEKETLTRIKVIKDEIDALQKNVAQLKSSLQGDDGNVGKTRELEDLEEHYNNRFWVAKEKYSSTLSGSRSGEGMRGVIGSKDQFKRKILEQAKNTSELLPLNVLEEKAKTVFSSSPNTIQSIPTIKSQNLLICEKDPIIKKRIIGKDDVNIAAMIKKLGNSDWVKEGLLYYNENDGICPFCQQKTEKEFAKSLSEYFDEAYNQDVLAIDKLATNYISESQRIQEQIKVIFDMHSEFVNYEALDKDKKLLDSLIASNIQKIKQKKKESSQIIELETLQNVLDSIVALIDEANTQINNQNHIIKNITHEKVNLTAQIWRFVIEELKYDISNYIEKKLALESAIAGLKEKIANRTREISNKTKDLAELEKQTTTIQSTKNEINKMLDAFGFKNFKLAAADEKTYKLIRDNGENAHKTLSEGERNFVTFLYFYYLLKGSQEETGLLNSKVVVFDDPISSLDNDVLFIVSTLIRELIDDVRNNKGTIKQVFVLTHNIYFHKEVTFDRKRNGNLLHDETFWLIKKNGSYSYVEAQSTNPIKTTYELLWNEVKSTNRNNATIQNTLRRIFEYFFKLTCCYSSLDKIYTNFDGDDKWICKCLLSWIHDGSHNAFDDDYYTSLDDRMISKYLDIFKRIFLLAGYIDHYNMMMGIQE